MSARYWYIDFEMIGVVGHIGLAGTAEICEFCFQGIDLGCCFFTSAAMPSSWRFSLAARPLAGYRGARSSGKSCNNLPDKAKSLSAAIDDIESLRARVPTPDLRATFGQDKAKGLREYHLYSFGSARAESESQL